jgi:hypothetical protein
LKPAWANSSQDPISEKTHHKKDVGSEFKSQYSQKKERKKEIKTMVFHVNHG